MAHHGHLLVALGYTILVDAYRVRPDEKFSRRVPYVVECVSERGGNPERLAVKEDIPSP